MSNGGLGYLVPLGEARILNDRSSDVRMRQAMQIGTRNGG